MKNLTSWNKETFPFISQFHHSFTSLQNELDKTINEFYKCFNLPKQSFSQEEINFDISPSIDIVEDDKNFKVEVEMPGMREEDIKVSVSEGMLTLKGEKKTSKKDENKNYLMREISYGKYERSISLPKDVDTEKAKASFRKGILWVTIPKKPGSHSQLKELKIEKA